MGWNTTDHAAMLARCGTIIDVQLQRTGRGLAVLLPDIVPQVDSRHNQRVPGLAVTFAPQDPDSTALLDPVLVVEIPDDGNAETVRHNLHAYASIPSVRELLVLDSRRVGGCLHRCDEDGMWRGYREDLGPGGVVELRTVDLKAAMPMFYESSSLKASS